MKAIDFEMQMRNFQLRFEIHIVFNIGTDMIFCGLSVLTDQHKNRKEDRFQRVARSFLDL